MLFFTFLSFFFTWRRPLIQKLKVKRWHVKDLILHQKTFFKFKINAFLKKLQKSVIFDIFGVFGLKTTSDHKSEVLKVAFKFDFTSENIFWIWNQAISQEVTKKWTFFDIFAVKSTKRPITLEYFKELSDMDSLTLY